MHAQELKIIESLRYAEFTGREERMVEAEPTTFDWLFADTPPSFDSRPQASLLHWLHRSTGVYWISGKENSLACSERTKSLLGSLYWTLFFDRTKTLFLTQALRASMAKCSISFWDLVWIPMYATETRRSGVYSWKTRGKTP